LLALMNPLLSEEERFDGALMIVQTMQDINILRRAWTTSQGEK
jgi:hypothetical protein